MSKKINAYISGKLRPNLHALFHSFLNRKASEYDPYDDWDDYSYAELAAMGLLSNMFNFDDEDDYSVVYPISSNKKGKKKEKEKRHDVYEDFWDREEKKRNKKRYSKNRYTSKDSEYYEKGAIDINTPYSGDEEDAREVDITDRMRWDDNITIYFYPNYLNKYDKLEFNTLKSFDDFCADEGFIVPPNIAEGLAYHPICHTCLNPSSMEDGKKEIYAAESYADMVYDVCDVEELSQ